MNFSQNKKKWHFRRAMAFWCFFVKSFPFFFNLVISVWNLKKLRYSVKRCSSCSKRHRTFWPEAHFGGNLFFQPLLHESIFCRKVKKIEKKMVLDLQLAVGWKLVRVNKKYKISISVVLSILLMWNQALFELLLFLQHAAYLFNLSVCFRTLHCTTYLSFPQACFKCTMG